MKKSLYNLSVSVSQRLGSSCMSGETGVRCSAVDRVGSR